MSNLSIWLTPLWLLACGTTLGVAILLVAWGICWLLNRRLAETIRHSIQESILMPISYVLGGLALLAVLASPTMPYQRVLTSIQRLPAVGQKVVTATIPPGETDFEMPLEFEADELRAYSIDSQEDLAVNVEPNIGFEDPLVLVEGGQLYQWSPNTRLKRAFEGSVAVLFLSNQSDLPTTVTLDFTTDVEMPQVHDLALAAKSVVLLYVIYLLIRWLVPRISIIATATAKEAVSQPLYPLLLAIGITALIAYVYVPYNTFGEDVKMLKTSGMTTIKILAILMALWTASVSVSDEIEGRTALTVLSKPVSRRQFILGKFLGIIWPILLMFVVLGVFFLLTVSYKVVYDAREASKSVPTWQLCYSEVVHIIPGLILAFFEAVVLAAVSVAISTRLPMLPNLVACGSIYVLGHLGPLIVKSAAGEIVFVQFIGRLISVMLPVLDHYEIEGAIAGASTVPTVYLWTALFYSALYCTAAMLLALVFFEDRDLA